MSSLLNKTICCYSRDTATLSSPHKGLCCPYDEHVVGLTRRNLTDLSSFTCESTNFTERTDLNWFLGVLFKYSNETLPVCSNDYVIISSGIDPCQIPTSKLNRGYIAFWVALMIVILSINSFVCIASLYSRNILKVPSHRFILSLAVSDIMVAVFEIPLRIKVAFNNQLFCLNQTMCHLAFFTDHLVIFSAILILFAIGIDRYIAVSKPYKYGELMSKKRANIIIATIWIVGVMFGFLANIDWHTFSFKGVTTENYQCTTKNRHYTAGIMIIGYFVPLLLMGFIYYKIFRVTMKHASPIATIGKFRESVKLRKSDGNSKDKTSSISSRVRERCRKINSSTSAAKLRASRVVVIVYGTFVVCWLPGNIVILVYLYSGWAWAGWRYHVFNEVLPLMNSAFNVFLYALVNEDCKKAMRKLLHSCCKRFGMHKSTELCLIKSHRKLEKTKSLTVSSQSSQSAEN